MLDANHEKNSSVKLPIWGYLISAALILAAYIITIKADLVNWALVVAVITIASVQCLIQLVTFLNLGLESKPKWAVWTSIFTLVVIVIVFGGSLWIMKNISYNLMPPRP